MDFIGCRHDLNSRCSKCECEKDLCLIYRSYISRSSKIGPVGGHKICWKNSKRIGLTKKIELTHDIKQDGAPILACKHFSWKHGHLKSWNACLFLFFFICGFFYNMFKTRHTCTYSCIGTSGMEWISSSLVYLCDQLTVTTV